MNQFRDIGADGRTDGRTDGMTDGRKDEGTEQRHFNIPLPTSLARGGVTMTNLNIYRADVAIQILVKS